MQVGLDVVEVGRLVTPTQRHGFLGPRRRRLHIAEGGAVPRRGVMEAGDGGGATVLDCAHMGADEVAALSDDVDLQFDVTDHVAPHVAEGGRSQAGRRISPEACDDRLGGPDRQRGDDPAVHSLQRPPVLVDVRSERSLTQRFHGDGGVPVHRRCLLVHRTCRPPATDRP